MKVFETGAKRDESEMLCRYDLIPPEAMEALAQTLWEGANKYGDRNWEKGITVNNLLNHSLKHIFKFMARDKSEPHLEHAMCNLAFAITMIKRKKVKMFFK